MPNKKPFKNSSFIRVPKIQVRKFKELSRRLLFVLAERALLTFLGLLFIALLFGAVIYYQYSNLVEEAEIKIVKEPLRFQEKTYHNVLKIWQERERKFKEAGLEELPDLPQLDQGETSPEEFSGSPENDQEEVISEQPSGLPENEQEEAGPEELEDSSGVDQG